MRKKVKDFLKSLLVNPHLSKGDVSHWHFLVFVQLLLDTQKNDKTKSPGKETRGKKIAHLQ